MSKETKMPRQEVQQAQDVISRFQEPAQMAALKEDPTTELQKLKDELTRELSGTPAYQTDRWIYRMVVASLGLTLLIAAVGAVILASNSITAPDVLVALGSGAIGALAGLLAPSPVTRQGG
jgi:hypothetical protein